MVSFRPVPFLLLLASACWAQSVAPDLPLISLQYSAGNASPASPVLIGVHNAAGSSAAALTYTARLSPTTNNWLRVARVGLLTDTSDSCPQDPASYSAYPATLTLNTVSDKLCITAAHTTAVPGNYSGFITLIPAGGTPAQVIVNLNVGPSGYLLLTPDPGVAFNENILIFATNGPRTATQTVRVDVADPANPAAKISAPISYSVLPDANPLDWLSVQCVQQDRRTPCGNNPVTPVYFQISVAPGSTSGQLVAKVDINSLNPSYPGNEVITVLANIGAVSSTTNSISGQVTVPGLGGLGGVLISLNTGATATTTASGTYSFATLSAGNYVVTPSLNGYTFSPASANISGLNGNQSASFTAAAGTSTLTDIQFITRLYQYILARPPEPAGLSYWQNKLTGGETRGAVADEFLRSPEYASYGLFIVSNYVGVLGREPELAGYEYWFAQMRTNGRQQIDVINGFLSSPEYAARFGNPDVPTFVTELYNNVLGRNPDPGGFQYWTGLLNTGQNTRPQVVRGFVGSSEFQATTLSQLYVELAYFALLNRAATAAELMTGKQALAAGVSTGTFLGPIVGGSEFLSGP